MHVRSVLASALTLCGCNPDEHCIDSDELWAQSPSGLFCVRGDLEVTGRNQGQVASLARLESVSGSLFIHDNPQIVDLPDFAVLASIGGSVSISKNPHLVHVRGFSALREFSGGIFVAENPLLVGFEWSADITVVESLFFGLNTALVELHGHFERVDADVTVVGNDSLKTIEIPALVEIGGNLSVERNDALQIADFPALHSIGEVLRMARNDRLEQITGFGALRAVGDVQIEENAALKGFVLSEVAMGDSLIIAGNARIEWIEGADGVRFAAGTQLMIFDNPMLQRVEGFNGAVEVGFVYIRQNDMLREISGLNALKRIADGLQITHNPSLVDSRESFAALVEAKSVSIYANASLQPEVADEWLAGVMVEEPVRVGDNLGQDTALDPCPWPKDGTCDAMSSWREATELCAEDPEDC